jgi:predicted PurR-regulated permease PerM
MRTSTERRGTPLDREPEHPLRVVADYSWRFLVVVAAGYVFLYLVIRLRVVVLPVIAALFITALLHPLVDRLRRRGWKPLLATWVVLLAAVIIFAGFVAGVAYPTSREMDELGSSVRQGTEQVLAWLAEGPLDLSKEEIDGYLDDAGQALRDNQNSIVSGVVSGARLVAEAIAGIILALVLTFFFLKDGPMLVRWLEQLVPRRNRDHAREMARRSWATIGAYLRGTATVALVDAVLIGLLLLILGVPLVIPLALLTFIGGFFPLVGATLAGIVAALVALVTEGTFDALIVGAGILVIQQVEGDVLQPVIMGRAVRLHPVAILLALTAGAVVAGVVGAFLAVPIAAMASTAGNYLRSIWSDEDDVEPEPVT